MNLAENNDFELSLRPHVLVVDDDARICELVARYLQEHGFMVLTAAGAAEARDMMRNFAFDVMVVDVMMPGETGLELTRSLQGRYNTPVLLLTALGEAQDRITGLEAGADDYLAKPFEPRELVLRLNAILRRAAPDRREKPQSFRIGKWRFDPDHGALSAGNDTVALTGAEINLIRALAAGRGEPVSREILAAKCGLDAGERTIDVQVTRLRRKLEEDTKTPRYLQTVRGKGYLLRTEDL